MKARSNPFLKSLSLLMVFLLAVPFSALAETAKAESAKTSIKSKEPFYVVPGKRITLKAEVKDPVGIKLVRCYFRAVGEADYVFVPMAQEAGSAYAATLPAPADTSTALEFVLLAVNAEDFVVKTKPVTIAVNTDPAAATPNAQKAVSQGTILVSSELAQAPQTVTGFADDITVDVVESAVRFGMVAGLVSATAMAAASGGSTATVAGVSTVSSASGIGLSTTAIVGIAAGVAAAGAGIAVAAGGGGGSGGGGGGSSTTNNSASNPTTWTATLNPPNPGPGQDVTVTVTVNKPNVSVNYNVSGTDGYSDTGTKTSDSNGAIAIFIPGGAATVTDTVVLSVPSLGSSATKTLVYHFG